MTDREIYPNAPLRFVAFEARFPHVPPFGLAVPPEPLRKALQARFPRSEPANVQSVEIGPGAIRQGAEMRHRFLSRDRTIALTLGAQSLSVETANYHRFEDFRESIAEAVDAVEALAEVSGLLRVGLRYVDELRVPVAISALTDWAAYVDANRFGVGAYVPITTNLTCYRYAVGRTSREGACSYFAPVVQFAITPGLEFSYDLYLTVGTVDEMRAAFRRIHHESQPAMGW